ncbi:MAG TPA: hypothetical protein PKA37_09070, partial [Planctomycetota bacterium]|nr:hypothetical protein [Planctomycetota bacterium]
MNLAPVRTRIHASTWSALLVFFGLALVPLVEVWNGNYPGSHLKEPPSWEKILNGQLAQAIATDLSNHSVCAQAVRPYYNEGLYLLFRRVNPDVTLGKDHWLFLSPPKFRFTEAQRLDLIERYARAFISVSKSLKDRGTEVVWAVVPAKAAIHPEKLPDDYPERPSLWPAIAQQLEDAEIAVFPVEEVIRRQPYPQYISDDTHWNHTTAQGVWKELAQWLRQRGLPIVGPIATGRISLQEGGSMRAGGLLALLGFNPGGSLHLRFCTRPVYSAVNVVSKASAADQGPILLLGTSFSAS